MSSENGPLISTLRSLQLKSLKEVSVGNKFATILDRPVYNALFPHGTPDTADGMLEEEEWDENETLLALAGRSSDRPLRAWLGVAVDHNMLTENMAAAVHRALRERYGPSSNASSSKSKPNSRTQPLWSPGSKTFPPSSGSEQRTVMGTLRVCRQCRRDHQRCDRAAGKQCKRCLEHGWNCAESIPKSPTSAKRKRQEDDLLAQSPDEDEDNGDEDAADETADIDTENPTEEVLQLQPEPEPSGLVSDRVVVEERDPSPAVFHPRRSASAASSSNKSRRQRSLSNASVKEDKPNLRELRTLERETQIPGSKRRRQSSAVDVALDKMGLRKTAANIAFLTEAGLISPDPERSSEMMGMDAILEVEADKVEQNMAVDNAEIKVDEEDAESAASTHDEYSFFGENGGSAVGTPATVSDPHMTREASVGPTAGPSTNLAKPTAVADEASPNVVQ